MRAAALILCAACLAAAVSAYGAGATVEIAFDSFFPQDKLQEYVPFEIIFRCKNTGSEPINPYAEVTVSGAVYDADDNEVLDIDDQKYRLYNFWPGDQSGRLRLYIGKLKSGTYTVKLIVNAFNRVKGSNISTRMFEKSITVR